MWWPGKNRIVGKLKRLEAEVGFERISRENAERRERHQIRVNSELSATIKDHQRRWGRLWNHTTKEMSKEDRQRLSIELDSRRSWVPKGEAS